MINVKLEQNMDEILNIKDLIGYISLRMNEVSENYPLNLNFVWNDSDPELFIDQKEQTIAVNAQKILFAAKQEKDLDIREQDFSLYEYFKTGFLTATFRGLENLGRLSEKIDCVPWDENLYFNEINYDPEAMKEDMAYDIHKKDLDSFFKNAGSELNKLLEEKYKADYGQEELEPYPTDMEI